MNSQSEITPRHQDANAIEAPEKDYLYTQASQIDQAGHGLYTAIDMYEQEIIAHYEGERLSHEEAEHRAMKGEDQYFIMMLDGTTLDSKHTACYAKYANDAEGAAGSTFSNNAQITLDDEDNVCIIATEAIQAGEEIFCSYGKGYWEKHG